jgi:hypothetical protein
VRLAAFFRVILYLGFVCAAALGMLAVRTYPAERTWVDAAIMWKADRDADSDMEIRAFRRACGWRIVFCDEMPAFRGTLAATADSLFANVATFHCAPGMGWSAFKDGRFREAYCFDSVPDTHRGFATDLEGSIRRLTHRHGADPQRSGFAVLKQQYVARLGPPTICPPESETGRSVHLTWQVGPVIRMLEHTNWDGLVESWEVGQARCWSASPEQ